MTVAQTETNSSFANQMETMFSPLNKNNVPHGILLDYGMEFTNVPAFNGTLTDSTYTNLTTLKQIYNTLLTSRVRNVSTGFVTPQTFNTQLNNNRETGVIALTGLYFKYAKFIDNATITNKLTYNNGKFYDKYVNGVRQNPYETKQTFAISPAIKNYRGFNLQVKIPANIFYSNYQDEIQSIQIDFDNGQGYITMPFNQNISIIYTTEGVKNWRYKLVLTNGTSLYNQSRIKIEKGLKTIPFDGTHPINQVQNSQNSSSSSTLYSHTITATTPYENQYASVNLTIDDANNDGIKKPLIVAEGFDLGILLQPENINGNFDYSDFKAFVSESGPNLRSLIWNSNKEYDIIYVDWNNGVDYMQRNAYALQEVIKWVNQQKANNGSTEQNVVLGQSMGGVISRYALADMEENSVAHDTRLFISHDAPQQGANLPVSIQFMYRHLTNQYIQTNTTLFGGIVTVPILENNFGVSEYLSLLDAPASRQLVKNFSTLNYQIDNTIHDDFYNELKNNGLSGSGGYPLNTRNIAISNGSECGTTQDFNAGEHLVNYQWNKGLSFWGDLASLVYNPLGGAIGGLFLDEDFFGVAILGLIPGQSKYNVDFQAKSIPYGTSNQIYKGRISYTKKILWLFNVTINITNVQKNQPSGILPFDTYGGGFFNTNTIGAPSVNNLYIRDKFSFIPTASALDIGKNNINLTDNDYLDSYIGAVPPSAPKNSPFINFSTEFDKYNQDTHNKQHISFNSRNGDWLAAELIGANVETTDCSAFCSNAEIIGENGLCNTGSYHLNTTITPIWSIVSGSNLATLTSNGTTATLTQTNPNMNGLVTLQATITRDECGGSKTITKQIWVGKPDVWVNLDNPPTFSGQVIIELNGTNSNLSQQGITSIFWEKLTPNVASFNIHDNQTLGAAQGPSGGTWAFDAKVTVTNSCGSTTELFTVQYSPVTQPPCEESIRLAKNPMQQGNQTNLVIILPCNDEVVTNFKNSKVQNEAYTISIFNKYYRKIYSKTQYEEEFDLSNLEKGFYIVKYQTKKGNIITKKLMIN